MSDTAKYPRLKAAVFWHERWQNRADEVDESAKENAGKYSDLRVNSSPGPSAPTAKVWPRRSS